MVTIRGTFNGETFKPLPTETVPSVDREVPVAIVFLDEEPADSQARQRQIEIVVRMRASRQAMPVLSETVKDLVEAGRER